MHKHEIPHYLSTNIYIDNCIFALHIIMQSSCNPCPGIVYHTQILQSNESTGISTFACSNHNTHTHKHIKWQTERDHRCLAPLLKPNKLRTSPTYLRALKNGIKCSRSLSVGSDIHPSIGIAFSIYVNISFP